MFTGIIEEKGRVIEIIKTADGRKLSIEAKVVIKGSKAGDSISVDGICLTLVSVKGRTMTFDVMEETFLKTNLASLKSKRDVNLERALKAGDRISGHFVTGHVDCTGKVRSIKKQSTDHVMEIKIPEDKMAYVAEKGSIAIEGVSLTIAGLMNNSIKVCLIPLTLKSTNLFSKKRGDCVNVEFDILGKYSLRKEKLTGKKSRINEHFLKRHGFLVLLIAICRLFVIYIL